LSSHPVGIPIFQKSNIFAAENFAFWGSIGAARHHAVTASRLPSLVEKIIVFEIASPLTSKMSRVGQARRFLNAKIMGAPISPLFLLKPPLPIMRIIGTCPCLTHSLATAPTSSVP